jgi:hypothetical protein
MGFGWNTRDGQTVQMHNGRAYDFKKIAQRYEQTPPLRGKRKAMDIRPHGERRRDWERIVKVNDNEYYLTNNAYKWYDKHEYSPCRAITFKRDDEGNETIIVHTPRQYWGDKAEDRERLMPRQLGNPSSFYFYNYNLPEGLGMDKYYTKNYLQVKVEDGYGESALKFYTLDKGDVHLTRQVGEKYFKPLIVHREVKRSLDRKKTKALRDEMNGFKEYVRVMLPLVEHARQEMWESPIKWSMRATDSNVYNQSPLAKECHGKHWRGLFTGEPSELSFKLVQYYKYQCRRHTWNPETRGYDYVYPTPENVMNMITNQVYAVEKPLHEEPVELGVRTFDKYRSW